MNVKHKIKKVTPSINLTLNTSGALVGAQWGNIGGIIDNQTDLQTELNNKLETETDPVFTQWESSTDYLVENDNISLLNNDSGYITGIDSNDVTTALGFTPEDSVNKGQNNGYASLDNGGKVPVTQLPSSVMHYLGTWNADTNTPTISDGGSFVEGDIYLVSVAGTQDLGSGEIIFAGGDWVVYNGTIWEKSINSNAVVSVNEQTGVVDIGFEHLSGSPSDVITAGDNLSWDNDTLNAVNTTYAFNTPLSETDGTVNISQANSETDGYLSSTDWNTFNDKLDTGGWYDADQNTINLSGFNDDLTYEVPLTFGTGLTRTAQTITTNDGEIDHNSLNNYNSNEHIDWSITQTDNIHADNYTDTDTTYTFNAPLSETGENVSITQADSTTDGYLSSVDWNTFNDKADSDTTYTAGDGLSLTETEFSVDLVTVGGLKITTGELEVDEANVDHNSLNNYEVGEHRTIDDTGTAVTDLWSANKIDSELGDKADSSDLDNYQLTSEKGQNNGYASLDEGGKVPGGQLPSTVMHYLGTWNADTNTPTLSDAEGEAGDIYLVSVAGTQDLGSGSITFAEGDWVVYNGTIWEKSINSNAVVSVNTQTGVVDLGFEHLSGSPSDVITAGDNLSWTGNTLDAVDTTYTAGTGLDLTGTEFSNTDTGSSAVTTHETTYNHNNFLTGITGESLGDLSDVDLTGIANDKILKYNSTSENWEVADEPEGTTEFTGLTDTPADYTGNSGKAAIVNEAEDGLEFGVAGEVDKTDVSAKVIHGSTAAEARPTGFVNVNWQGDVEPTNAENGDVWINTE